MADAKHLARLKQGVSAWNAWRRRSPSVRPDLSRAWLIDAELRGINLANANLERANLRSSTLSGANLRRANLRGADLRAASLRRARLDYADLTGARRGRHRRRDAYGLRDLRHERMEPARHAARSIQPRDPRQSKRPCCQRR
jgi:hypothetical protein